VLLFDTVELSPDYLRIYIESLQHWNMAGLPKTQFVVISQRKDAVEAEQVCKTMPPQFSYKIVSADQDWVDGYPIWDVLASLRQVWTAVEGRYVTFNHAEYIWTPGSLERTIDWLEREQMYYTIGNLRRPGRYNQIVTQRTADHCIRDVSDKLYSLMVQHRWPEAKRACESMHTTWWVFWSSVEQRAGRTHWVEDVFFLDKEWLDAWHFIEHGGELPFQDVYDLLRVACLSTFPKYNIGLPYCYRMPIEDNRMIHLWHPKVWGSWSPEVRDWFLSNQERWKQTKFLDPAVWNQLIEIKAKMPKTCQPVNSLRNAAGGTVTRYGYALSMWLKAGGAHELELFYQRYGRERRK
jgi:hypothetical protein